jgi:hypothetical protein
MKTRTKYEPFDNFIVTMKVCSLPAFDLIHLKNVIAELVDSRMSDWHFGAEAAEMFEYLGTRLVMVFDGDDLIYDRGGSDPSSPFGVLTVMLASELDA